MSRHSWLQRVSSLLLFLLQILLLVAGCAVPGRLYPVAPPVSGELRGDSHRDASLLLRVQHRETPNLHHQAEVSLPSDGAFSFEAVELAVAGHEFSKFYRAHLELLPGTEPRIIWRAEFSRRELAGPVRLDCDLDRPREHGQPCQVVDPLEQPWLVSAGRRTFGRLCASCHGRDGGGGGDREAIERVGRMPPDLRSIASRRGGHFDRIEISEWVEGRSLPSAHGSRVMPIWGERLSTEYERFAEGDALIGARLDPVVVYLESIQD